MDMWKNIASGIAITCFLFVVSIYIPFIGFVCSLFIPLPILFFRLKLGRSGGMIVTGASMVFMGIVLGGFSIDVLFFAQLLMLGFVLGELMEQNLSVEKTVLYTAGSVLVAGLAGLLIYSGMSSKGAVELISDYISKNLELTLLLYEKMEAPRENIDLMASSLDNLRYILVRITPSLVTASTLFVAWTSLLISRPLLRSGNLDFPDFGPLNIWKPPEHLVWVVIGCGGIMLLPDKSLRMLSLNGLIVLMTIYFFVGIAIVSFYFQKKNYPRILRVILYSLIALQQIILLVVIGLGFFDLWLNFRRLNTAKDGPPSDGNGENHS